MSFAIKSDILDSVSVNCSGAHSCQYLDLMVIDDNMDSAATAAISCSYVQMLENAKSKLNSTAKHVCFPLQTHRSRPAEWAANTSTLISGEWTT